MTPTSDGPDEYPTEEELGDETVTLEDISPFSVDTDGVDDINALTGAEWAATTTPEDRVKAVVGQANTPDTVAEIADAAVVPTFEAKHILDVQKEEEG